MIKIKQKINFKDRRGKIIDLLRNNNAKYAGLSGSGSTVFGIYDDEAKAILVESIISKRHKTLIVDPV